MDHHRDPGTHSRPQRPRSDGWTTKRQLIFLGALAEHKDVGRAAAAGMSREGAYRFRNRSAEGLFAALWDLALAPPRPACEVHTEEPNDRQLIRVLNIHFRRERRDFARIGQATANRSKVI